MVEFAKEASPSQTTLAEVFASLANSLIKLGPPEKDKLKFLNETWKVCALDVRVFQGAS